jgi:hypothetical protein
MTYLEIVNNVLRRIREDEVISVADTIYSKMVGDFVNDAKQLVEDAWDWSALYSNITVAAVNATDTYTLTGSQSDIKIFHAYNDTSNAFLEYRPKIWFDEQNALGTPVSGSPEYYTLVGVDGSGDTTVQVYPIPDASYTLNFKATKRNSALSNDADNLSIPASPVIHLAVALLARERGETGGTSTAEYFAIADKFLSDAIALDAQKTPETTVWYTP